jgi:hypothetical protein
VLLAEAGQYDKENTLTWTMPLQYSEEYSSTDITVGGGSPTVQIPAASGVAVLAVLGGLLAAMWPCLFQLTAYFILPMAGMSAGEGTQASRRRGAGSVLLRARLHHRIHSGRSNRRVRLTAAIGYGLLLPVAAYLSIGAGVILLGMVFRVAAKSRAPLVCKMPIARKISNSGKTSAWKSMVVGVAFATRCMT